MLPNMPFNNLSIICLEFEVWKEEFETTQNCSYSKSTGKKERNGTNTTYYYCNRTGSYSSKGKGTRTLKSQGSCKIGGHCTSTIKLIEKVGCNEVEMNICKTHYGHKVELGHIPIPKADKLLIGCKRKLGIDKTRIINDIQDSTTAGKLSMICSLYRLINKHLKTCSYLFGNGCELSEREDMDAPITCTL